MKLLIAFLCLLFISVSPSLKAADSLPALGTVSQLGRVYGVEIETAVQSPSAQKTPLQVVCLFEYTEGDIFNSPPALPKALNGMVHVDEALNGLITDLRKASTTTSQKD